MRNDFGNWQRRFMRGPHGKDPGGPEIAARGPHRRGQDSAGVGTPGHGRRGGRGAPPDPAGAGPEGWIAGDHDGQRGRFRRGRGGGGRFFDHGELRQVVLALIGEQARHGYDIIRAIEQRTGGLYAPSPGVIYPTLQLLEDVGHVTPASADGPRNLYQITAAGRAFLDEHGAPIGDIMARMARAGRRAKAPPVIVAAMDNLKSSLRSCGEEAWTETECREIAATIDAAAQQIRGLRQEAGHTGTTKESKR